MTVVPLDAASDPARFGHKAATLSALRRAGHLIPDGFVIPVGATIEHEAVGQALAELGHGQVAVRSSGVAEDLPDASHAGRYETVLGVDTTEGVVDAARLVLSRAGDGASMGVLVQQLVAADSAGVAFTANPVTGDDEVIIEAVAGLGDQLLSGAVDGERWTVRDAATSTANETVLDAASAQRIAELGRRVAAERGGPQDIEWAISRTELYLLQARPITNLPRKPVITFPPGRWTKDTSHFTGPVSPAGASLLLPSYEVAFSRTFAEFGVPLETIRQRAFGGEVYTQDVEVGGRHDPSAPPPWWVIAVAARVVPSLRERMRAARDNAHKLETYPQLWPSEWRRACRERIEAAAAVDLTALDDRGLLAELDRLVDEILIPHLTIHFQLTMPHMVGMYELVKVCEELLGWDLARSMRLVTGISNVTTTPTQELAAIASQIPEGVLEGGLDAVRATDAGPALDAWLATWGLRTIDADPGSPMIAECEDLILSLLRGTRSAEPADDHERRALIDEAHSQLAGAERTRFDERLAYAEVVYPQRDDNVLYTEGLSCGLVRRLLLEVGTRLHARGRLDAPTHVAFLEKGELGGALEGDVVRPRVQRRQAETAWVLAHPGPFVVGPPPVPFLDPRGLPKDARRLMEAIAFSLEEEFTPPRENDNTNGTLAGVGVSPGHYTGPARVIRSEAELKRLMPGDILVCPTTHSSWAFVFGQAGALVCDGGGMLSHPAIIAREHRIPAVVATGTATSTLVDGQRITVDGNTGTIVVCAHSA